MIDLRTLAHQELLGNRQVHDDVAFMMRCAMRYLAHREKDAKEVSSAIERGECDYMSDECIRRKLDAAADRLIQEMLK